MINRYFLLSNYDHLCAVQYREIVSDPLLWSKFKYESSQYDQLVFLMRIKVQMFIILLIDGAFRQTQIVPQRDRQIDRQTVKQWIVSIEGGCGCVKHRDELS